PPYSFDLSYGMGDFSLTTDQTKFYHEQGYLGPFRLCDEAHILALKESITSLFSKSNIANANEPKIATISQLDPLKQLGFGRHHDTPFLYQLITRSEVLDRVASILGEDLLLWRSMFFVKDIGEKRIPWHQDLDDWPIEPFLALSVWIAIDETTAENGCVEIIPGSHRNYINIVPSPDDVLEGFPHMADPACFDENTKVKMTLKPGEFFIFNERLLHQSASNRSSQRRTGLAVRFIPPMVRILDEHDKPVLVNGQDKMHFNTLVPPPLDIRS
ncbi:MAG: phytanoyl-CoA dioxygenase family protein, partial [Bacteroidota bacterium]|nr:phytanoyl-CoA dioxygenase family protein [Bacteroidota bacterium]